MKQYKKMASRKGEDKLKAREHTIKYASYLVWFFGWSTAMVVAAYLNYREGVTSTLFMIAWFPLIYEFILMIQDGDSK